MVKGFIMKIKVYMITTWEINCGIATYSNKFFQELCKLDYVDLIIIPIKNPSSLNPFYFLKLLKKIENPDIIHIQFHPDLFGQIPLLNYISKLNGLISYFPLIIFVLKILKGYTVIITVHEFTLNFISKQGVCFK